MARTAGRPSAEELERNGRRCHGVNHAGARCGAASLPDLAFCSHHLSDVDKRRREETGEELIRLTGQALRVIQTALDLDQPRIRWEDRLRAAALIMQRTLPTTGPAPVQVNILGKVEDDGNPYSESDFIRKRLAEVREANERLALAQGKSQADQLRDLRADDVIDAEIITEEPAAAQDIPAEPWPQREATG